MGSKLIPFVKYTLNLRHSKSIKITDEIFMHDTANAQKDFRFHGEN